jgi:ubiquinone/menaquinone biosynthesis C-methylase UbiE
VRTILRIFFQFLYHQFAFTYDLVAAAVSFGHWKDWILEVVPFIEGTRTLEIGHGPGHLQRILLSRGLVAVAIDESASMSRLAKHNTDGSAHLTRGLAQHLPFCNEVFDTIIATFPTEYFTDPQTLSEVKRCLSDGGRFVVLPAAMPKNWFLAWLFKVTGQASSDAVKIVREKLEEPFIESNFDVETHIIERNSGTLIVIVAKRNGQYHAQKTS